MYNFKVQNGIFEEDKPACTAGDKSTCILPFSKTANSAYVRTKSGIFKLVEFVNTKRAKQVLQMILVSYFQSTRQEESAQNNLSADTQNFSVREKLSLINKYIDKCNDKKLRDQLIQIAADLLKQL